MYTDGTDIITQNKKTESSTISIQNFLAQISEWFTK